LLDLWLGTLADKDLDLGASGVTGSMVYWADLLYPQPVAEAQMEAADTQLGAEELPEIGLRWVVDAGDEEAAFIGQLAEQIGYDELASDDPALDPPPEPTPAQFQEAAMATFEVLPVPWFVKRRLMKIFLRDVHHYLFDVEFEARPGEKHRIQTEIRRRALEKLREGAATEGRHIVVAHSLGTVIAYDCLKRVGECPAVDGLLTIGSPLGLSEVQEKLEPEYSKDGGFPDKLTGSWVNVYDPLDPVAGLDPKLADEYRRDGGLVIEDINEPNEGVWRHSIVKYLGGPRLRERLAQLLDLG
jgi:hypothetical protein